jgi:hypothetical protein
MPWLASDYFFGLFIPTPGTAAFVELDVFDSSTSSVLRTPCDAVAESTWRIHSLLVLICYSRTIGSPFCDRFTFSTLLCDSIVPLQRRKYVHRSNSFRDHDSFTFDPAIPSVTTKASNKMNTCKTLPQKEITPLMAVGKKT